MGRILVHDFRYLSYSSSLGKTRPNRRADISPFRWVLQMKINEFIKNNLEVKVLNKDPSLRHMMTSTRLPQIVCSDGFKMSVQVGFSLYSTPKKVAKRYSAVEIGYPSDHEPLIEEYAECYTLYSSIEELDIDFTNTVYPYVPVKIVDKVLRKHGGIDLVTTTANRKRI